MISDALCKSPAKDEHVSFLLQNYISRLLVGGRVRAIMSGGAPLAPDTHDYLKSVLGQNELRLASNPKCC